MNDGLLKTCGNNLNLVVYLKIEMPKDLHKLMMNGVLSKSPLMA